MSHRLFDIQPNKTLVTDLAVIGGGASGVLAIVSLLRQGFTGSLTVVEPADRLGRGVAYGSELPQHTLNVRAGAMSAYPQQPNHFVRWCESRSFEISERGFSPRGVYGEYLESCLNSELQNATSLVQFHWLHERASRLDGFGSDWLLTTEHGTAITARIVVFATGYVSHPGSIDLAPVLRHDALVLDPWSDRVTAGLKSDAPILIVGTGLTMADVLSSLRAYGHRGRVTAISRHGLLPRFHSEVDFATAAPELDPQVLLRAPVSLRSLRRAVIDAARNYADQGGDPSDVIQRVRTVAPRIWRQLSPRDRARFLCHLRTYWDCMRHRIPSDQAALLQAMLETGQLLVEAGRIENLGPANADSIAVDWRARGSQQLQSAAFSRVILATGPGQSGCVAGDGFVERLCRDGWIELDPLGLGPRVDHDGVLLAPGGQRRSGLFALGPARRGSDWESTAIPEIRQQAQELANHCIELLALKLSVAASPRAHPGGNRHRAR